jgi:hypothetical protein
MDFAEHEYSTSMYLHCFQSNETVVHEPEGQEN